MGFLILGSGVRIPPGVPIYGVSSMDRVAAYEAVDEGSTPPLRTINLS